MLKQSMFKQSTSKQNASKPSMATEYKSEAAHV
jgi:hypothetical protein